MISEYVNQMTTEIETGEREAYTPKMKTLMGDDYDDFFYEDNTDDELAD